MPENKVALFIDFDNIRIGIRQHFGTPDRTAEIHPQKLMAKASKYGRVTTAKAYADFTGHPKEFQDKLLFAAGIEPIHAPSKISGGRRQSSADMHMVIDMFLEAIDHEDVDTFILMSGDADFVRMVATLRRRFGRKVIISGVQSTSTSLDLMNSADARDPITRQDCDMTGELGRLTRPLVTRADLDAEAAAAVAPAPQQSGSGGFLSKLFGRRPAQPAAPTVSVPTPVAMPAPIPAPRRLRATELRGGSSSSSRGGRGAAPSAPSASSQGAGRERSAQSAEPAQRGGRGRAPQRELSPVSADSKPDEVEERIIREIHQMPAGRQGYLTMKTIEETLRSKAGEMGSTRKEIPIRLERLATMGMFRRVSRPRGSGEVETGELVSDHPGVANLTAGVARPEAPIRTERAPRLPRAPRGAPRADLGSADAPSSSTESEPAAATPAMPQPEGAEAADAAPAEPATTTAENAAEGDGSHFRWVTPVTTSGAEPAPDGAAIAETTTKARSTAKRAPRKATPKATPAAAKPRAPRAKKAKAAPDAPMEAPAEAHSEEPQPVS